MIVDDGLGISCIATGVFNFQFSIPEILMLRALSLTLAEKRAMEWMRSAGYFLATERKSAPLYILLLLFLCAAAVVGECVWLGLVLRLDSFGLLCLLPYRYYGDGHVGCLYTRRYQVCI